MFIGGENKSGDSSKYEPLPWPGQMSEESTLEKLNTCLKGSAFLAGPELTQVQLKFSPCKRSE